MSKRVTVTKEWIKTQDGQDLFTKTFSSSNTPIATVVMIHGFGEHIGRYDRMFTLFASHDIECYGYDQRGYGETVKKSGDYGNNQGNQVATKDIDQAIIRRKREGIPLILMGHSMGGGLILNYLGQPTKYKGVSLVNGAIASAPLIELSMPLPAIKYYGLMFLSYFIGSLVINVGINPDGISTNKEEVKRYMEDPLVHDYATIKSMKEMLEICQEIPAKRAASIKVPILYSHGDADPINSHAGTVKAYKATGSVDKEMKTWKGLYHELHYESKADAEAVMHYYIDWIKKHSNQ
ncbi:Alpha/Beta hydrolase protein [Pilobolus umbonatus]|nr:Alpha/Beta hydrolase protein [Pilobolus umbonatus]